MATNKLSVGELIAHLQTFDQNLPVLVEYNDERDGMTSIMVVMVMPTMTRTTTTTTMMMMMLIIRIMMMMLINRSPNYTRTIIGQLYEIRSIQLNIKK